MHHNAAMRLRGIKQRYTISKPTVKIPSSAKPAEATMAQRIRLARRRAGLSQAELAKRSAVTASAVAQWEHPRGTRPSLDRLQAIAKAMSVQMD